MNTLHFQTLSTNISNLTNHFGGQNKGSGVVCPITLAAYKLLVHAEIEQYFEDVAALILQSAIDEYARVEFGQPVVRHATLATLISLASYATKTCNKTSNCSTYHPNNIIRLAIEHYKNNVLRENHGIKHENIDKLFKPIGFKIEDNYPALISALTTFGVMRGDVAHKSAYIRVSCDLASIISTVQAIITQTESLDTEVMASFVS